VDGITLRAGKYEATFRPDAAMLCASLRFDDDEYVAWPRSIDEFRAGRATAIPLVHPWANRLAGETYRAAGEDVSLAGLTLPHDPNGLPMHGNLFGVEFEVQQANDTRVVATLDYGAYPDKLRAFPFPHLLTVDARLHPKRGLNIVTRVHPTAEGPVPISFGWHPFLQLPNAPRSEWELRWPVCRHVEVDERVIPTGTRTAQPAQRATIADRTFDDHYALGADRTFSISAGSGSTRRTLTLLFDPSYPYAQLFVPPGKEIVAIEPMTAEIDALGRGAAPIVKPGERFQASFTLAVTTR
jgi:galactose mutarotase-like enzyme